MKTTNSLKKIETLELPTKQGKFLLSTYKTKYPQQKNMHFVLTLQTKKLGKKPLVRIHSSCVFSEVFGSLLCDCQSQLEKSMKLIQKNKDGGIIFYLDQEGRGHGIFNKTIEMKKQELGLDTVEASEALGLNVDDRDYTVIIDIMKIIGLKELRLLTNNPHKIESLSHSGFTVTRIPLRSKPNKYNKKYLEAKKRKLNHLLSMTL